MKGGKDAGIIIVIVIVLAIGMFSVRSGRSSQSDSSGNGLVPTPVSEEDKAQTPPPVIWSESMYGTSYSPSGDTEAQDIERQIEDAQKEVDLLEAKLEEVQKYGETSPYKGMVDLRIGTARNDDPEREYVQLRASTGNVQPVRIDNWVLESAISGRRVKIGKAVKLFYSGTENVDEQVLLEPGDQATIITGRSPIGESFEVTKCTGYFTQFQRFYPSISTSKCPLPEDEILSYTKDTSIFIDNECMDFVERIRRCTVQTKPLPLSMSYACQDAIVNEINYNSCIDKHKNDADFYAGDWRIYMRRSSELWREKRELIKLLDENGKTVDYYSY